MRYSERLFPAPWIWISAVLMAVGLGLALKPISNTVGLLTGVLACALIAAALIAGTPVVSVESGELRAGRARIPLQAVGEVEVLDPIRLTHLLGQGLDARAFLCIRGWIRQGVKVTVTDPSDPTPYWLITSRRPDALAQALAEQRASAQA